MQEASFKIWNNNYPPRSSRMKRPPFDKVEGNWTNSLIRTAHSFYRALNICTDFDCRNFMPSPDSEYSEGRKGLLLWVKIKTTRTIHKRRRTSLGPYVELSPVGKDLFARKKEWRKPHRWILGEKQGEHVEGLRRPAPSLIDPLASHEEYCY